MEPYSITLRSCQKLFCDSGPEPQTARTPNLSLSTHRSQGGIVNFITLDETTNQWLRLAYITS